MLFGKYWNSLPVCNSQSQTASSVNITRVHGPWTRVAWIEHDWRYTYAWSVAGNAAAEKFWPTKNESGRLTTPKMCVLRITRIRTPVRVGLLLLNLRGLIWLVMTVWSRGHIITAALVTTVWRNTLFARCSRQLIGLSDWGFVTLGPLLCV